MPSIKKLLTNKIVLYMSTRYATYILAFFVNLYVATKMGPGTYGVWSFLILVFHYLNIIDLGIPHSVQVYLVQNKDNKSVSSDYEKTGLIMMLIIALSSVVVALYYSFGGIAKAQEFKLGWLFYGICLCGFINYINNLYDRVYRSKNRLFELAFKQTSVVFFMALAVMSFSGSSLLMGMVLSYIAWCVSSLLVFVLRGGADFSGSFSKQYASNILKKGFFLFFFHAGFSFIIMSTRTIIGTHYSIEDFGLFSFAYFLGHSVYNCVLAFSTVTITKLLHRFHSSDRAVVLSTVSVVRINYVTLFHGVLYLAIMAFPLILHFMPKYESSLLSMMLCALMMLLYTNSYGYASYLIATNREKKLAFLAISSLFLNITIALFLAKVVHVPFEFVVFATMFSYLYYAYMCTYYGRKSLELSTSFGAVLLDSFPFGLIVPFILAIVIAITGSKNVIFIPFLVFLALNKKSIVSIFRTIKKLLLNPNIVDI